MSYLVTSDADPETDFAMFTVMPSSYIAELETLYEGWIDSQLAQDSAWIDGRLRKRYAVPFAGTAPLIVRGWLGALVARKCFLKLGVSPTDRHYEDVRELADTAKAELLEAANGNSGLLDVPTSDGQSAVVKRMPRFRTQQSPFVWRDDQREEGREEDYGR